MTDLLRLKSHAWIKNTAFTRLTGLVKVCMDCGLAMERGERLDPSEKYCPGRRKSESLP